MSNEVQAQYQITLEALVNAKDELNQFVATVALLDEEVEGAYELKRGTQQLIDSVYNPIKDFLEDWSMHVTSSQMQELVDFVETVENVDNED